MDKSYFLIGATSLIGIYVNSMMVLSLVEAGYLRFVRMQSFDWSAFFASYFIGVVRNYMEWLAPFTLGIPFLFLAYDYRLTTISLTPLAWGALFIGEEFLYYWLHRTMHENRWFWSTHFSHHTSEQLSMSASFRTSWTDQFAGNTLFLLPLAWIGFAPAAIITCYSISNAYQIWLHTNLIPKLGWFEWVFNTPSHHRVHHARNPEYLNANYGGVLVVFDRLFGTFVCERDDVPCDYGLVQPFLSHNPFKIAFYGTYELARDIYRAKSWSCRAQIVFGRSNTARGNGLLRGSRWRGGLVAATDAAALGSPRGDTAGDG